VDKKAIELREKFGFHQSLFAKHSFLGFTASGKAFTASPRFASTALDDSSPQFRLNRFLRFIAVGKPHTL